MIEHKKIIDKYEEAFRILDEYDHLTLKKVASQNSTEKLEYNEVKDFIGLMRFNKDSNVFGKEKEIGKLDGILKAIEQSFFDKNVYESVEEKAANLLYFLVKDHPFVDGCKRIAAGIFLLFLEKNFYFSNGKFLSPGTVSTLTILIAESNPEEKEIIIKLVMNILFYNL